MESIIVKVYWNEQNFECVWACEDFGTVIVTHKTLDGLKLAFEDAVKMQIADMLSDGEDVPQWLCDGRYSIVYDLEVSAILRDAEQYTTMAAISKVSGINSKQLSHYANSVKRPRAEQRKRIIDALHSIGEKFMAIC